MNLEWNVYVYDTNSKKIKTYNIFNHGGFLKYVEKDLKKYDKKEDFAERLKGHLLYYFGHKCEWETVVTSWVPHITISELERLSEERAKHLREYNRDPYVLYVNPKVGEKIDVRNQVMLNQNQFVDYVWSQKESLI